MNKQEVIKQLELLRAEVEWERPITYSAAIDEAIECIKECINKDTPQSPEWVLMNPMVNNTDTMCSCPNCNNGIRFDAVAPKYKPHRCEYCGQVLKWEE